MPFKVIIVTTDSIQIELFFFIWFVQQTKTLGPSQVFICETAAAITKLAALPIVSNRVNSFRHSQMTGVLGVIKMNVFSFTWKWTWSSCRASYNTPLQGQ